ncbi:MAG: hypothetical protein K2O32_03650 [Acetatifactor sp.]|nr:hypothetical protein [Acetatifactor sp.]
MKKIKKYEVPIFILLLFGVSASIDWLYKRNSYHLFLFIYLGCWLALTAFLHIRKVKYRKAIVLPLITLYAVVVIYNGVATKTYESYAAFKDAGGYTIVDIPDEAYDCRFAFHSSIIRQFSMYSFTLDEDVYRQFIENVLAEYKVDFQDEMNRKYGYAHWYGMKVADCNDPSYALDDFPVGLPFEKVSDTPIEDYTTILYSPTDTGSRSFGVVALPEERRLLCYEFSAIR